MFEALKVVVEQVIEDAKSDTYFQKPNTNSTASNSKNEIPTNVKQNLTARSAGCEQFLTFHSHFILTLWLICYTLTNGILVHNRDYLLTFLQGYLPSEMEFTASFVS